MEVNSIGLPTTRSTVSTQPAVDAKEVPGAKNYVGNADDLSKVNTAKSSLPEGVGARVDSTT